MIDLQLPSGPLEVLCLGAHPDDVEIGCGGTLLELGTRREIAVRVAVMTGDGGRRDEACAAAAAFSPGSVVEFGGLRDGWLPAQWRELKGFLEELGGRVVRPDIVFCPRRDDAHQDHRLLSELVSTVWRDSLVLEYEIPKWDGDFGSATTFVEVRADLAQRKIELLDASYPSQVSRDWWDAETFLGLMRLRGVEIRRHYAEAFVARGWSLAVDQA